MAGPADHYCPHERRGLYKGDRVYCYCSLLKQGRIVTVWAGLTYRLNIKAAQARIRDGRRTGALGPDLARAHCEDLE